jgi:hypothetical protein
VTFHPLDVVVLNTDLPEHRLKRCALGVRWTSAAILLLIASTLNPAASAQAVSPPGPFLLSTGKAGQIELGASVDEVYRLYGRDNIGLVDLYKEGYFSPALTITMPGSAAAPAIVADIREWPCAEFSVWGIDVRDPRFRTSDGLGVGSTGAELRSRYQFQISEAEGAHAAVVEALKMSFSLDPEVPVDRARVTSVWIWPDPVAVRKRRCPERGGL